MTDVFLSQSDIIILPVFLVLCEKDNMKSPLRLGLSSITVCCVELLFGHHLLIFHLFCVSSKNSSSFNNLISILPVSHNDHCFVMQCFEIVLLVEI